jgi:hypothetical protein
MYTETERREHAEAQERALVASLRSHASELARQLDAVDADAPSIDWDRVRRVLREAERLSLPEAIQLAVAREHFIARRDDQARERHEAELQARRAELVASLPARLKAMRRVLEGDTWSEAARDEYAFLQACGEVTETDRSALRDLYAAHTERYNARLQRETAAAKLEEAASRERERAERQRAWMALSPATRIAEVLDCARVDAKTVALVRLVAAMLTAGPEAGPVPPPDWRPQTAATVEELLAHLRQVATR